jgi:acyl carrier protein
MPQPKRAVARFWVRAGFGVSLQDMGDVLGAAPVALDVESLATGLEAFVRARFRVPANDPKFHRETDLWEDGYVDSAGVVEVLSYLENVIGCRLPEALLFEPAFTTISGMARLSVEHQQGG